MKYLNFLMLFLVFCLVFLPVSAAYGGDCDGEVVDSKYLVFNCQDIASFSGMEDIINKLEDYSFISNLGFSSASSRSYVGSYNTGKFHWATCHYVKRIKSYNKVYFSKRQAAIAAGYSPCKVCKP